MKYEDVNKPRGVFMLLASFSIPDAQAANPRPDGRLYKLSDYQLARENREQVAIYTGFTDTQVERVLSDQFDHVQYMMFVNTIITNILRPSIPVN